MGLMTAGGALTTSKLALANATEGDVLKGKKFYAAGKALREGTMPNRGAWSPKVGPGESVAIPQGYYSGGTISGKAQKTAYLGCAGTEADAWAVLTYNVKADHPSIYNKLSRANFYAVPYRWQGNSTGSSGNNGSSGDNISYNPSTGVLQASPTQIGPGGTWAGVLNYKVYMVYYD
ncbi:MAG: hypothetical protein DBX91_03865 [Subdoligranulum variabile]|nr:MAG: hypothetical protein DBX91_03865 [Subdoligranulum variabile]